MKLFFRISLLAWFIAILVLSILPGNDMPSFLLFGVLPLDKFGHFGFYGGLCFLLLKNFQYTPQGISIISKWKAFSIAVIYGILMELIQGAFFPSRCADIHDVIANTMGAILGIIVFAISPYIVEICYNYMRARLIDSNKKG